MGILTKDTTAKELIPPTTLGSGKTGFGGAINKAQKMGTYTEGETTYGTPLTAKADVAPIQGTTGFGGAMNKVQKMGTYKEGETTYGTPIAEGALAQQVGGNIPNPNPNGDLQPRDADKGVENPSQGDAQATSQVPNIDVPKTFFQKNKMPILIGGGVAVVAIIGLIAFSVMSSNK